MFFLARGSRETKSPSLFLSLEEHPVSVPDFLATICSALGIDPTKQNNSNAGRPIRLAEKGAKPIKEIL